MDNNQMNFDPITGQPINQNNNVEPIQTQEFNQPTPVAQPVPTLEQPINTIEQQPVIENNLNPQQQMQNIATVEQSKEQFINNTQTNNEEKKENKDEGPNLTFIIILFVIIFAAIFFLFPYLLDVLG